MEKLSLKEAVGKAWGHFERRGWYLFSLTAAVCALAMIASGEYVTTALAYILFGGYLALLLKHARSEQVVFDDLFTLDQRWIYYAFHSLIKGVIIVLGLMFFIVPGVFLMVRLMFSGLYVIDHGMRPFEALKASYDVTADYQLKLFLFLLLSVAMTMVGLLFFLVGVFAAVAVINLSVIMLFWKVQELQYKKSLEEHQN